MNEIIVSVDDMPKIKFSENEITKFNIKRKHIIEYHYVLS